MLKRLFDKKSLNILGVNSGTSVDSLDLSLTCIVERANGQLSITELAHRSVAYPSEMREQLLALGHAQTVDLAELMLTDEALGAFIGKKCKRFILDQSRRGNKVDLIASHGQTIRHLPQRKRILGEYVNSTMQIGSAERIATLTALPVVANFRQAQTALGAEGAPITTSAVCAALRSAMRSEKGKQKQSHVIINIGGISNVFYVPSDKAPTDTQAFDIGPGNMLLDLAAQKLFSVPYDTSGALAKSGAVSLRLLTLLENKRFFNASVDTHDMSASGEGFISTQSVGREQYGENSVAQILTLAKKLHLSKQDIMATLSQLTAEKILETLKRFSSLDENLRVAHITGGGFKNKDLIQRIRVGIPEMKIIGIQKIGYHPDFFEALSYAILGYFCIKGIGAPLTMTTLTMTTRSSAQIRPVLGRIIQPPIRMK